MREMVRFAFCTLIGCAGVEPSASDTFSTAIVKQHPFGTVMIAVLVTLPYSSTAAGVNIARLVKIGSPSIARAIAIGVTVPSSGMAIFPLNVT